MQYLNFPVYADIPQDVIIFFLNFILFIVCVCVCNIVSIYLGYILKFTVVDVFKATVVVIFIFSYI